MTLEKIWIWIQQATNITCSLGYAIYYLKKNINEGCLKYFMLLIRHEKSFPKIKIDIS